MIQLRSILTALVMCAAVVHASFAAPPLTQVNLNTCQNTVKASGANFVKAEIAAIAACLQKISTEQIRNDTAIDSAAARTCITQFRKLYDTRNAGKSLIEILNRKIQTKCDPAFNPPIGFTIDDVTGKGSPNVPVPINTQQLDLWCKNFGGDGSIDDVPEWIDCIAKANQCEVDQAIAEQYPRAAEWLSVVKPIMNGIASPATDPNKTSDAVTGLTAVHDAIDAGDTGMPHIYCPGLPAAPVCSTACCYIEQTLGSLKPTACFEYEGSSGEVTTFKTNCQGKQDSTGTQWTFTAANGTCSAGPTYGVPCQVGVGNNAVAIPKDSACP